MLQLLIFIVVDINEKQVKGETIMINVACYTLKEVDDILKIAEAVGFECANHTKPTSFIGSKIYEDGAIVSLEFNPQQIVRIYSVEKGKRIDVSANELLMLVSGNSDEMTAKEFIHKYKRMNNCEAVIIVFGPENIQNVAKIYVSILITKQKWMMNLRKSFLRL